MKGILYIYRIYYIYIYIYICDILYIFKLKRMNSTGTFPMKYTNNKVSTYK